MDDAMISTGLDAYFDFVILSSQSHLCRKPCHDIFWEAIRLLDFEYLPEEILYVGNNFQRDIIGASKMGFHTAHVERPKNAGRRAVTATRGAPPTYWISDIHQLLEFLL